MIKSHFKKFATLSLSAALFAGIGITATASATTALAAQSAISVAGSPSTAKALGDITVSYTGGSGTGAVSYAVAGTGCSLVSHVLTDNVAGHCAVTVTKAGDSTHKSAFGKTTFTFTLATQDAFSVSNANASAGVVNTGITLTHAGGSGTGAVKFALATNADKVCTIKNGVLARSNPGTCTVSVSKAKDTTYAAATSASKTFTFSYTDQSALTITNTGAKGATAVDNNYSPIQDGILTSVGTKVTVSTSGGSGTGKLTFTATTVTGTAASCAVSSKGVLTAASAAVCSVVAHKAAQGVYGPQNSAAQKFIFQPLANVITLDQSKSSITAINNTTTGDANFINAFYAPADHWYQSYMNAGSTATLVFLVKGIDGTILKNAAVTLIDGLSYSGAPGTQTFAASSLNAPNCGGPCVDGIKTGRTNASGEVTFLLQNTNTFAQGTAQPSDLTTGDGATANEQSGNYPWNRFVVVAGTPSAAAADALFTENLADYGTFGHTAGTPTITQTTDIVDLITIPAAPQAALSITNSSLSTDNGGSFTVTTAGGSGTGVLHLSVSGTGCDLTASVLTYVGNDPGACTVTALKDGDDTYASYTTSAVFSFGNVASNPTVAKPDTVTATVTGTGLVGSQILNNSTDNTWLPYVIGVYYQANDPWTYNYVHPGAVVTVKYHVTGSEGQILANQSVALDTNFEGTGGTSSTWTVSGSPTTGTFAWYAGTDTTYLGTTDANGDVSFTLTNSANADFGPNAVPADITSAATANGQEGGNNSPNTRMVLIVGNDVPTAGTVSPTVNEVMPLTDFIVIPTVAAQATLAISNGTTSVANGTSVTLTTSGGSGSGAVSYSTTDTGCSITAGVLTGGNDSTCSVVATKAADASYNSISSASVTFTFGTPPVVATAAHPYVVTASITGSGLQNSTPLDNTANADGWFITQYYNNSDTLTYSFIDAGSTVSVTYHVTKDGAPVANKAVALDAGYEANNSATLTPTGDTASLSTGSYGWYAGTDSTYLSTTDSNGDVTFTFTNSANTLTGNHLDITSVDAANNSEYNKTNSNARLVLIVGEITNVSAGPSTPEVMPVNDIIVNPSA